MYKPLIYWVLGLVFSLLANKLCAQSMPSDLCSSATPLVVGSSCTTVNYTTVGSTVSGSNTTSCGTIQGGDVWFQLVVPASGQLQVKVQGVAGAIASWALYSDSCSLLSEITCNGNYSTHNIHDSSFGGQTLYIRVWRQNNSSGGSFSICAWEPNTPNNDFCSQAISLPVGTTCINTTYNNMGCTAESTSVAASPSCGIYHGGDVWFKVTVPASGHLRIEKNNLSGINAQSAVYAGTCGAFTQLGCTQGNSAFNLHDHSMGGQILYIRVWDFAGAFSGGTFNLCAWEPSTAENDSCQNAMTLPIGSTCNFTAFNSVGSTADPASVAPTPTCGFYNGGDLWYKVMVPLSGHLRIERTNGAGMSTQMALYSGACGNMTQVQCAQGYNAINIHDHSRGGQELFLRIWDFGDAYGGGSFSLCAFESNPPENDFCANAIPLVVGQSCSLATFSALHCSAEPTSISANPTCGNYSGGDVWFTLVVPLSGHLRIERSNTTGMNAMMAVYSGACGAFTLIGCSTVGAFNLHNHALGGQTIMLRIWNFGDGVNGGNFGLCVWEPNTSENDFCANAITLSVDTICSMQSFNSIGATSEAVSVSPNPGCGFYAGGDIWFKFTVPMSGHLRIERSNSSSMNAQFALFTGTCGNMTPLQCAQSSGYLNIHDHSLAGQVLYLRVWNYNDGVNGGAFTICAWEPAVPENDFCMNAVTLNVGTSCSPIALSSLGCTAESISLAANPSCGFYNGGDIWYKMIVPVTGLITIDKTNSAAMNVQFALYSGTCGNLTQLACVQQSSFTLNNISLAGQTVYLRVWNYNSSEGGPFDLCVYDPTCLITLDSIVTTPSSCNLMNDASLTVYATCTLCTGSLEYAINNGSYQSNHYFGMLSNGTYIVKVRDSGNPSCMLTSSFNNISASIIAQYYYQDLDGDGYGKSTSSIVTCSTPPPGYVALSNDCNDNNNAIHPGVAEILCNDIDENCNGIIDDKPVEVNVLSNCIAIVDGDYLPEVSGSDGTAFGATTIGQSKSQLFYIENKGNQTMQIMGLHISGSDSSSFILSGYIQGMTIPANQDTFIIITFTPLSSGIKNAVVNINTIDCDEGLYDFAISGTGTSDEFSTLNLKWFIEGFYLGSQQMAAVLNNQGVEGCSTNTDSAWVVLKDTLSFLTVDSARCVLQTNGTATCRFANRTGTYYVAIYHRNAIQTWSAVPVTLGTNPAFYDFSTNASAAYGSNQTEAEAGVWAFYSGDINQEENVDLLDNGILDYDINAFSFGYMASDINGDGNVDLLDLPIVETNINNFIYSVHP